MAIYSLNAKLVSRGKGQSLVGQTAYICRTSIVDDRTGVLHSYSEKYVDSVSEVSSKIALKRVDDLNFHESDFSDQDEKISELNHLNASDFKKESEVDSLLRERVKEIVISDVIVN